MADERPRSVAVPLGETREGYTIYGFMGSNRAITPWILRRMARALEFMADEWGPCDDLPAEQPTSPHEGQGGGERSGGG